MGKQKIGKFTLPEDDNQFKVITDELKMLGLDACAASFEVMAEQIHVEHGTMYDFLQRLLELQITHKEENRVNRWIQQAKLIPLTTLSSFNFKLQPSIDRVLVNELATCRFIEQGKNIILLGPPGVGKTHLATALGFEAIQKGYDVRCMKLNEFIEAVRKNADDSIKRLTQQLMGVKLLILDDIDYYTTDDTSGQFLFDIIKQRYNDNSSTIITSNKSPREWGNLFGSDRTHAAVDRLFDHHRAITINIKGGQSYRVPQPLKELSDFKSKHGNTEHRFLKKMTGAFLHDT